MKYLPLLLGFIIVLGTSCGQAPSSIEIMPPLDSRSFTEINDLLDEANGISGPRLIRIYLSRNDGILSYRLNDRVLDKEHFEKALAKIADIDSGQTLAIEFGESTSEHDLDVTPSIKQFFLIGRNGRNRDSLRIIK